MQRRTPERAFERNRLSVQRAVAVLRVLQHHIARREMARYAGHEIQGFSRVQRVGVERNRGGVLFGYVGFAPSAVHFARYLKRSSGGSHETFKLENVVRIMTAM